MQTNQLEKQKCRVKEIFQNIFQEVFLTNCGNPINIEQTLQAFQKHMGSSLTQEQTEQIEIDFMTADLNNVSHDSNMASLLNMKCLFFLALCLLIFE